MSIGIKMIRKIILDHIDVSNSLLDNIDTIEKISSTSFDTINSGKKIFLCGNGGSASDASHIAAELVGRFQKERDPLPAISLTDNMSSITSIGNDYNFDEIFARQLKALGRKDDLLIAISTSGNSQNVLNAIKVAKSLKMKCFILSGINGGKMSNLNCDIIKINSKNTARVQEMHILVGHIICSYIDENI
jgi:D-sedoheptulose 7-phosphate isomerase